MDEEKFINEADIETGWKNPPALSELKQNYQDALEEHNVQQAKIDAWLDNLHITGSVKLAKVKGRSNVQPKLIRKQAEWRYPALTEPFLSTDDLFNVYPITAKDVLSAQQNQLVLNNQFNTKLGKVKFIDEYVRSAVDTGTVIVRVGWYTEEAVVEEEVPVFEYITDPTGKTALQYAALAQLKNTDPANIIIDPSCDGDLDKAQFIIFNFETSKSALRKAGKYSNIDSINPTNASPLNNPDYVDGQDNSNFSFKDDSRAKFVATEYWGFWDIHGTGVVEPFVATWVGDTIIRLEESPFPDKKLPFEIAVLMPVSRSVYGEPDGELLADNQAIIGAVSRGMIDLLGKSAAGQTGMRKDFLDVTNARKYRAGLDYEYNGNVDPRLGVFQHTYPEIPQSAYNMLNIQNAEAESFSGVKAFNSGISSQSLGEVAAGIRGALDAASKRELGILRRLADGIIRIGRKIIAMNSVFLSEEEVVRITDEKFVAVRRDDLAGNFDLKLTISTAEEDNQKAQELAFMLQTVGPNDDPAIRRMIQADIARLRKMPQLAKAIEEYQPQPDPLAVEKAQLEIVLLKAQIANEQAQAQQRQADGQKMLAEGSAEQTAAVLNMAKANTERAKARQITSDADIKDLDYVEQESGVKQERDLQKISRQSEAQAKTKIIEAMLKPKPAKAK